jgi:cytochrome c biogenesis protein CcdA
MPVLLLGLVGLLLLAAEAWAVVSHRRRLRHGDPQRRALLATQGLLGLGLGVASLFASYPLSSTVRIFGVPFITAIWQLERGQWYDYVGGLSMLTLPGNFLVAFLLPVLAREIVLRARGRRSRSVKWQRT